MLHAVAVPCHAARPVVTSPFYALSEVGGTPWKLAHPPRESQMLKHREIIGQGSHQTEPGVLPGQSPIMVRVYPTTRCQARRHQALGCQWGPGNQRALLWKPIFISLFFFFHPFALPTAVLIIFMNAPFQCSAGFQSVAMEEV